MTDNQIDNYKALQKQDIGNRKLIKKLQLDKQELKEQLRIAVVVGSLPSDDQKENKIERVSASTWGDYGDGYIDGVRNGADWVIDFVNGEDS
tara:strand:+ start:104 stop:379 length:276 start_codon:yes stop_codon:yes gene_type:complete